MGPEALVRWRMSPWIRSRLLRKETCAGHAHDASSGAGSS
jgi:hypothetical protein